MDRINEKNYLQKYLEDHVSPYDPVLYELYRETYLKAVHPQMLSGPVQGKFLEMMSKMVKPMYILEIGTYTGYSAICLARGLKAEGKLYTIEANDELNEISKFYFEKAGLENKIELLNGDAFHLIPELKHSFDIIFIDAEKEKYPSFYKLCRNKLLPGGYLIADNVLWGGKVFDAEKKSDAATRAIRKFNDLIQQDEDMENLILPVRDGLLIARRLDR